MKYCSNCGAQLPKIAKFCSSCGQSCDLQVLAVTPATTDYAAPHTKDAFYKEVSSNNTILQKGILGIFSKNINRQYYFLWMLALAILPAIQYFTPLYYTNGLFQTGIGSVIESILLSACALYALLLIIQRLNDIGWSRWYVLLTLIPIVNIILGVFLLFRKGQDDSHQAASISLSPIIDKKEVVATNSTPIRFDARTEPSRLGAMLDKNDATDAPIKFTPASLVIIIIGATIFISIIVLSTSH